MPPCAFGGAGARRLHERTHGNANRSSAQAFAVGREGPQQRGSQGRYFCYGVGNDVPGRAQNRIGRVPPLYPLTCAHEVDSATRWGRHLAAVADSIFAQFSSGPRRSLRRSAERPARAGWAALQLSRCRPRARESMDKEEERAPYIFVVTSDDQRAAILRASWLSVSCASQWIKRRNAPPNITVSTSANDFAPIKQLQLEKFDGKTWQRPAALVG